MKDLIHRVWRLTNRGRYLSQALFLGLTIMVTVQFLSGVRGATIERYCPFGGVETLIPWIKQTGTLCSLSTLNVSMLIGVIVITLIFKRAFCSHVCPMGAVFEWLGKAGRKIGWGNRRLPSRADGILKCLKYPLVLLIIILTVRVGELIFRDFDPYYVLFTAGRGHGIEKYGLWVTGALLLLGILAPLAFCKYLCPLAACLAPFGRLGAVRVRRDEEVCTNCGACDDACLWGVNVSTAKTVTSLECSNCQDCIKECPAPGALELGVGGKRS